MLCRVSSQASSGSAFGAGTVRAGTPNEGRLSHAMVVTSLVLLQPLDQGDHEPLPAGEHLQLPVIALSHPEPLVIEKPA
jgi:hypothetical protein